jgi:phosphoglycolate phosphatase
MTYHTLIFDLDGTLTDPLTGIMRCMNYALSYHDHQPKSEHEIKPYIGPPLELALKELSGTEDESHVRELVSTYRERYGELGYAENTVYDGIYKLLDLLQANHTRMGVCTSKFEKYAIKVLKEFKLDHYFEFVSGSSYGITKSEQLIDLINNKVVPQNSLMIGDRGIDLIAARTAGMSGAGVLWGYGNREELAAEQPRFLFETPELLGDTLLSL